MRSPPSSPPKSAETPKELPRAKSAPQLRDLEAFCLADARARDWTTARVQWMSGRRTSHGLVALRLRLAALASQLRCGGGAFVGVGAATFEAVAAGSLASLGAFYGSLAPLRVLCDQWVRDATHAATLLKLRERCAAWLRKVKAEWSKNAKRALAKQKLKLDARHEATNAKTAKRWQRALDAALSGGRVAAAAARPASSAYPRHARKPECAAAAAPDSDDDATLGDEPFPDDDPFDDGLRATMAATFKLYPDPIPV